MHQPTLHCLVKLGHLLKMVFPFSYYKNKNTPNVRNVCVLTNKFERS